MKCATPQLKVGLGVAGWHKVRSDLCPASCYLGDAELKVLVSVVPHRHYGYYQYTFMD